MIAKDQPSIFGEDVIAAVSSVSDGNMRFGRGDDDEETFQNRLAFLYAAGVNPENATLVQVTYENAEHFARYKQVGEDEKGEGIFAPKSNTIADALVVTKPNHALFLPLADCAGIILYDAAKHLLMVSHVGRHSAEIDGARTSVEYLVKEFQTNPSDLKAWVSPAVGKATYPIHAKGGKSLHEVIHEQLHAAGLPEENIELSSVDTATDENYFSHSQFKRGNRKSDGRFVIVAQMIGQGEPAF
jgi:copper oxidase (laccase) domain-containing protein